MADQSPDKATASPGVFGLQVTKRVLARVAEAAEARRKAWRLLPALALLLGAGIGTWSYLARQLPWLTALRKDVIGEERQEESSLKNQRWRELLGKSLPPPRGELPERATLRSMQRPVSYCIIAVTHHAEMMTVEVHRDMLRGNLSRPPGCPLEWPFLLIFSGGTDEYDHLATHL